MSGQRVLIVDPQGAFAERLAGEFALLGFQPRVAEDVPAAAEQLRSHAPHFVISEQNFASGSWKDIMTAIGRSHVPGRLVIVTAYGSIGSAVFAIRSGVTAYLAKPVTAANILDEIGPTPGPRKGCELLQTEDVGYCSLERAKWEYISMTVASAGSISEAARRLGLERRSLRRMLSKYPPPR